MIDFLETSWPYLLTGLSFSLSLTVTLHAVLKKPEANTVIAWVSLAWLAPFVGSFAYFCFGINRIQRKAIALQIGEDVRPDLVPSFTEEDYRLRNEILDRCPNLLGLATAARRLTDHPLLPGNTVTLLRDGDEAFPAMLQAIGKAERTISLLSYIFDSDRIGEQFLEAMVEAQKRGVEVRILIDHVGSRYSKPNMVGRLKKAGIRVAPFLPTRTPRLAQYANLRNHRKILVVDGRIGFTGGTNIREGHALKLEPKVPVQCTHFRLEGPVAGHLQEVFAIDWDFATGEELRGDEWFPKIDRSEGFVGARGVPDGPDEDIDQISNLILAALATASETVRIASPYFLPDPPIHRALIVTASRGVEVDIVLPSDNNVPLVDWAATPLMAPLLESGCRIHFSAPPFDHTKLMVIDGVWSLIGSTNWDPRSLRLNFEFNVECYSINLAEELEVLIDDKIEGGRRLALEEIENRSLPIRLRDGFARLMSPYL